VRSKCCCSNEPQATSNKLPDPPHIFFGYWPDQLSAIWCTSTYKEATMLFFKKEISSAQSRTFGSGTGAFYAKPMSSYKNKIWSGKSIYFMLLYETVKPECNSIRYDQFSNSSRIALKIISSSTKILSSVVLSDCHLGNGPNICI